MLSDSDKTAAAFFRIEVQLAAVAFVTAKWISLGYITLRPTENTKTGDWQAGWERFHIWNLTYQAALQGYKTNYWKMDENTFSQPFVLSINVRYNLILMKSLEMNKHYWIYTRNFYLSATASCSF